MKLVVREPAFPVVPVSKAPLAAAFARRVVAGAILLALVGLPGAAAAEPLGASLPPAEPPERSASIEDATFTGVLELSDPVAPESPQRLVLHSEQHGCLILEVDRTRSVLLNHLGEELSLFGFLAMRPRTGAVLVVRGFEAPHPPAAGAEGTWIESAPPAPAGIRPASTAGGFNELDELR